MSFPWKSRITVIFAFFPPLSVYSPRRRVYGRLVSRKIIRISFFFDIYASTFTSLFLLIGLKSLFRVPLIYFDIWHEFFSRPVPLTWVASFAAIVDSSSTNCLFVISLIRIESSSWYNLGFVCYSGTRTSSCSLFLFVSENNWFSDTLIWALCYTIRAKECSFFFKLKTKESAMNTNLETRNWQNCKLPAKTRFHYRSDDSPFLCRC